jgi:release factor glutamine methyltransferase
VSRIQNVPSPQAPQPRVWTSLELINWTRAYFEKKGLESPRLEAELLLSAVLECPRIRLYVDFEKPVPPDKLAVFREYVKRRAETREPVQYILGQTDFIDLKIKVNRATLIPRPETELLALWAVAKAKAVEGESVSVVDLCTGTGCVALYIAHKDPRAKIVATDISLEALALAKTNADALKLESRMTFCSGNLFEALPLELRGKIDLLVANPPYVDPADRATLQPEVRDHEPATALFAGEKGLEIIQKIIAGAPDWLKPGGWLGLEFGFGQDAAIREYASAIKTMESLEIGLDAAKKNRFLYAKRVVPL